MDTKQQTLPGVAFPMHGDAMDALLRFRSKDLNYVQLVRMLGFTGENTEKKTPSLNGERFNQLVASNDPDLSVDPTGDFNDVITLLNNNLINRITPYKWPVCSSFVYKNRTDDTPRTPPSHSHQPAS